MKKLLLLTLAIGMMACSNDDDFCPWEIQNIQQSIDDSGNIYTITKYKNSCTNEIKIKVTY